MSQGECVKHWPAWLCREKHTTTGMQLPPSNYSKPLDVILAYMWQTAEGAEHHVCVNGHYHLLAMKMSR